MALDVLGPPKPAGARSRRRTTTPGAERAKEPEPNSVLPPARRAVPERRASRDHNPKRLSATDISALASMKNVAKCDTWCELQNPVNHRVFERKLRPKPLGRGHVRLGVTQRRPQHAALSRVAGADAGLPRAPPRGWPKIDPLRRAPRRTVAEQPSRPVARAAAPCPGSETRARRRTLPA